MTDECVRDMAVQAKAKAMTIFLNHRYSVPEDPFGKVTDSAVTSRSAADDGTPIWDMDLDVDLAMSNPRVPKTYALIKDDGLQLGVSIGAMIEDYEFKDEKQGFWGGLVIKKVNLLEASIVGIPANQRSWVQNAVRAIKAVVKDSAEDDMDADDTIEQEALAEPISNTLVVNAAPPVNEAPAGDPSPDPKAAESPESPGNDEGDGSAVAESGEPSSDEQPTETASATDQPSITPRSGEEATLLEATASALEAAVSDLRIKDGEIASLTDRVKALTTERDAAVKLAEAASELIERIATTPLGRKTVIKEETNDFRSLVAKIYGETLAAALPVETNN